MDNKSKIDGLHTETDSTSNISESLQRTPTCIGFCEIDKYATQVYKYKFPTHKEYGDITKLDPSTLPDFDLLTGGFPCQAFSIAGKRAGFEDTRGTLIYDVFRIIKEKHPKLVLLENVKGLLSSRTTLTFDGILDTLATELSIKENICEIKFPINQWKVESENLGYYLKSINGIDGAKKNLKSLVEKIFLIMTKQGLFPYGQMQVSEELGRGWDITLKKLSLTEDLNTLDISILEKMVVINEEIVLWLKEKLEDHLKEQKLSTTSTETSLMTDLKTCISALQEVNIILFIVKQWKLSTPLWNKIKLNSLTANTYYVKTFNIIINGLAELGYAVEWQVLNAKNFGVPQNRERVFIIGHLGGFGGRQVFPITGSNPKNINQIIGGSQGNRVYDTDGVSCTQASQAGGQGAKTGLYAVKEATKQGYAIAKEGDSINLSVPKSKTRRGRVGVGVAQTIDTAMQQHTLQGSRIRRLTPTECERLMGLPDGWTEYGLYEHSGEGYLEGEKHFEEIKISDTQRYKLCGNGVVVNVVEEIIKKLIWNH